MSAVHGGQSTITSLFEIYELISRQIRIVFKDRLASIFRLIVMQVDAGRSIVRKDSPVSNVSSGLHVAKVHPGISR